MSAVNFENISKLEDFADGKFVFSEPRNFSIIFKNFNEDCLSRGKILVCFTSAVSNRDNKIGPFHSGLGLSDLANLPLVSISDYMVTNTETLSLAWYAGCKENPNFQKDIAALLDRMSEKLNCDLVLLGGSGAGFTCLTIGSLLKSRTFIISMNPQTSIERYFENAVKAYYLAAFKVNLESVKGSNKILGDLGVISNVCKIDYGNNIEILYLNNYNDKHHITRHVSDFFENKNLFPIGDNSFISENIGLYIGMWGDGHIPPGGDILSEILNLVCENRSLIYILRCLENGLNGLNKNNHSSHLISNFDHKLKVKADRFDNLVSVNLELLFRGDIVDLTKKNIVYAVYILDEKNNPIIKTSYSKKINPIEIFDKNIRVKVYIKDDYGRKITGLSQRV